MRRLRRATWSLLNEGKGVGATIDALIITLIAANVIVIVIESEPSIATGDNALFFRVFDIFSSVVFTIEYVLRVWTSVESPRYPHWLWGRLRYAKSPMALVDLIAILPFWLPMVTDLDLRFVRALRLVRLFRLLKIGRYSRAITALARVFAHKKDQLSMTFFSVSLALIVFSSLIYFIEHPAQPEVFTSIPQTMWWTAATLTTVGYGDMYPITALGQVIGGMISFTGVIIIAVPAGIVASGFTEEVEEARRQEAATRQALAREKRAQRSKAASPTPTAHASDASASGDDTVALACPHCGKPVAVRFDPSG